MIGLLLIGAGIYILVKGKIGVDNKRYLQKPRSIVVGIILIILGFLMGFVNLGIIAVLFVVTIVASYFMAEENMVEKSDAVQNAETQVSTPEAENE
jgi:cytochrome c biogenesis protein CcdA